MRLQFQSNYLIFSNPSISTASAKLFETFIDTLKKEVKEVKSSIFLLNPKESSFFSYWLPALVSVLVTKDLTYHKPIVTHGLPIIMQSCPESFPHLIKEIAKVRTRRYF